MKNENMIPKREWPFSETIMLGQNSERDTDSSEISAL
jgi:hypothetical protein